MKTAQIAGYQVVMLACPECGEALSASNGSQMFCEEDFAEGALKWVLCSCGEKVRVPSNPLSKSRRLKVTTK